MPWLYLLRLLGRGTSGVWDGLIFLVALVFVVFFGLFIWVALTG
jgi:hypothetical protein